MQQALVKILENAVEAIKSEGKINVETRNLEFSEPKQDRTAKLTPGNYVCVEISDTGAGIAPEIMPRIFEPFFTTKGSRHRGLGLAWVYGIITNHGGAVVCPASRRRALRAIYLPATRKIVRAAPVAPSDLSGTQTILFVDDEDLVVDYGADDPFLLRLHGLDGQQRPKGAGDFHPSQRRKSTWSSPTWSCRT
jgi:two-component system, cell cycle sensor histidine kinase and response regulator CckA